MGSSVRIDGSVAGLFGSANTGTIFSRGWAVDYDWQADRPLTTGQPRRLSSLPLPAPFDQDLDGVLRGRGSFSDFLYLFKGGQYIRLLASTLAVDGVATPAAPAWSLPPSWTNFDAVLPGSGIKINFAYFFRGAEYCRFDWTTDTISPGYPKQIANEWHATQPFSQNIDGVIVGQAGFSTKAYLFTTASAPVNKDGVMVDAGTPGSHRINIPVYLRYDFDAETSQGAELVPADVVSAWNGVMPLLDAGPAIDLATVWCEAALTGLATPSISPVANALAHHFRTPTPNAAQLDAITQRFAAVLQRLRDIPDRFQWTPGLGFDAQTSAGTLTEISDHFSHRNGPNGRAAVMIHEAVHFTHPGGPETDVPEWSGETINGVTFGIDTLSGLAYQAITTDQAITNPGSYASFAQEVALGDDRRYGGARRQE